MLSTNNILSAPVFEKETNNFLGFVDMMDLLANVVSFYKENNVDGEKGEGMRAIGRECMRVEGGNKAN